MDGGLAVPLNHRTARSLPSLTNQLELSGTATKATMHLAALERRAALRLTAHEGPRKPLRRLALAPIKCQMGPLTAPSYGP